MIDLSASREIRPSGYRASSTPDVRVRVAHPTDRPSGGGRRSGRGGRGGRHRGHRAVSGRGAPPGRRRIPWGTERLPRSLRTMPPGLRPGPDRPERPRLQTPDGLRHRPSPRPHGPRRRGKSACTASSSNAGRAEGWLSALKAKRAGSRRPAGRELPAERHGSCRRTRRKVVPDRTGTAAERHGSRRQSGRKVPPDRTGTAVGHGTGTAAGRANRRPPAPLTPAVALSPEGPCRCIKCPLRTATQAHRTDPPDHTTAATGGSPARTRPTHRTEGETHPPDQRRGQAHRTRGEARPTGPEARPGPPHRRRNGPAATAASTSCSPSARTSASRTPSRRPRPSPPPSACRRPCPPGPTRSASPRCPRTRPPGHRPRPG